jgi:cell division protein FtsB
MKKWLIILGAVLLLQLQSRVWVGEGSLMQVLRLKKLIKSEQLANQRLIDRNDKLDVQVRALKHQTQALEEHARSELGMIKKDETFYLVIDPRS